MHTVVPNPLGDYDSLVKVLERVLILSLDLENDADAVDPRGLGQAIADLPKGKHFGKVVCAFAVHGDLDVTDAHSNTFEIEWPKGSGRMQEFPVRLRNSSKSGHD